jgi:sporulation protein YlmC with PRC-barrel domain
MYTTKSLVKGIVTLSLVAVLSGYGIAAEPGTSYQMGDQPALGHQSEQPMPSPTSELTVRRAKQLIGEPVKNKQGQTLGTIYDLVLTPDLDQVSYVALSRGGLFGIGRNLYAVPWSSLELSAAGTYIVPVSEEEFTHWRGFRTSAWPNDVHRDWVSDTSRTGEMPPASMEGRSVQDRRASRIMGTMVKTPEGLDAGNIENLVIALDSGNILYTIVSFGGFFGMGSQYAAVPQSAIDLRPDRHVAQLNVNRDVLRENAFAAGQYPDFGNPSYARSLDRAYGTEPGSEWVVLGFVPAQEGPLAPETPPEHRGEQPLTMNRVEPSAAEYARLFDPSAIKTIEGTVTGVGKFHARETGLEGLWLRVRTDEGEPIMVYAGPRDYVSKQDFYAVSGDRISVTGAPWRSGEKSIFLATRIARDGQTLQLRDKSGRPLWPLTGESPEASRHTSPHPEDGSSMEEMRMP